MRAAPSLAAVLVGASLSAACAAGRQDVRANDAVSSPDSPALSPTCSPAHANPDLRPLSASRTSSPVALARWRGRTVALVAYEDDRSLHAVDVARRAEIGVTPLPDAPSQVLVTSDGRVLVTLRDASRIEVLEPGASEGSLVARCTVSAPVDPVSIAATPDDGSFVVASGWAHTLTVLRARDLALVQTVDVPREPRAVVVSADGARAFVAHAMGSGMSVVDLATGAVRPVDARGPVEERDVAASPEDKPRKKAFRRTPVQGFALAKVAGMVIEPHVLVDPGDTEAVSPGYGGSERPTEIADVLMVDEGSERSLPPVLPSTGLPQAAQTEPSTPPCLLPRAAAENTADGTLLVTCLGSDALVEYALSRSTDGPHATARHHWTVGAGPVGVAYDPAGVGLVWSQFDGVLSFVPLPAGSMEDRVAGRAGPVVRLALSRQATLADGGDTALGRKLFHAAGDARLSRDGRACASCHPDGRDDGLTWATPDGPRQTPMLAGRLAQTAPYAWSGTGKDLPEHLQHTLDRLGGSLTTREISALASYCGAMKAPPPVRATDALALRGKAIFASKAAGCAGCHAPGLLTDRRTHDVQTRARADVGAMFDTPSLRSVGGTAPYFHDGRYATLAALLTDVDGTMGHTAQLSRDDFEALEAYLRTL
jgi:mono/diheme cytochrome c family protein